MKNGKQIKSIFPKTNLKYLFFDPEFIRLKIGRDYAHFYMSELQS